MDTLHEKDCEDEPFLGAARSTRSTRRKSSWGFMIHLSCIIFNLMLFSVSVYLLRQVNTDNARAISRSKALPDIEIKSKTQQYTTIKESPYIGPPSSNTSEAWHSLFRPMSLRVTESELSSDSVSLPQGGHLAWLGLFHELHCVKILYQMNYRDHFHPNLTDAALRDLQVHNDHCIDQLRQAIMCHGDVGSLTTFVWKEGYKKPLLSSARAEHECLDWEALVGSLEGRVVGETEMGELRNSGMEGKSE